jgi:hypothetical protein
LSYVWIAKEEHIMPYRPDFWGIPAEWNPALWVYSIMFVASFVLIYRFYWPARLWRKIGRPEVRWDQPGRRVGLLVKYWIAQLRVLGQSYPGIMHVAIAWAFFVFFAGTALAAIDGHLFQLFQLLGNQQAITDPEAFRFLKGGIYLVYKLVLDLFTVAFLVGAGMAVYRRFVKKPSRLTLDARFTWSLVLIIVIVLGGLLTESLRLAADMGLVGTRRLFARSTVDCDRRIARGSHELAYGNLVHPSGDGRRSVRHAAGRDTGAHLYQRVQHVLCQA